MVVAARRSRQDYEGFRGRPLTGFAIYAEPARGRSEAAGHASNHPDVQESKRELPPTGSSQASHTSVLLGPSQWPTSLCSSPSRKGAISRRMRSISLSLKGEKLRATSTLC